MASLLCQKKLGGTIDTENRRKAEDLFDDDQIETVYLSETKPKPQLRKRPYSTPNPGSRTFVSADGAALIGQSLKLQEWLNEKSIKNIQSKSDLEMKQTRKLYDDVLKVENDFVKEMSDLVNYKQFLDLRKKELLHKRWTDRVYQPIRRQVLTEANSPDFKDLFLRKRQLYKEYLEHVNKKGHVFLETFDPAEYYPLSLNPVRPGSLTAHTRRLRDPLLSQERDRCSEDRVIIQCQVGSQLTDNDIQQIRLPQLPLVPLGRHGTQATSWVAMPMNDIESPVRLASRRRMRKQCNDQGQIHLEKSPSDVKHLLSEDIPFTGDESSPLETSDRRYPNPGRPLSPTAVSTRIQNMNSQSPYKLETSSNDVTTQKSHYRTKEGTIETPVAGESSLASKKQKCAVQTSWIA